MTFVRSGKTRPKREDKLRLDFTATMQTPTQERDTYNDLMSKGRLNKRFIGDLGNPLETTGEKAAASFGMVLFSLVLGAMVGIAVCALLRLSAFLTQLLWEDGYGQLSAVLSATGLSSWWLPLAFCTMGGLLIGLWTWRFGGQPQPLDQVLSSVKQTGGYTLEKPAVSMVGFLLPLVFGGSIGPEAGLTGIAAAACTKLSQLLKKAGIRVKGLTDVTISAALSAVFATPFVGMVAASQDAMPTHDDSPDSPDSLHSPNSTDLSGSSPDGYEYRRRVKLVLYTSAALGALAGAIFLSWVLGKNGGLPRFDGMMPGASKLWWALPCLALGYIGALLFHGGKTVFARLSSAIGHHPVLKPLIAGVVLGIIAIPLPLVLFPGEEQAFTLMESWQSMGAVVLIATGLLKCLATPLCLNFGWNGGHFFPCIFAGVALGYGLASLSLLEPMFCVAMTTATLVAGVQRKPLIALALLLMCFPASGILWMGIACVLGAVLPLPKALLSCKTDAQSDPSLRKDADPCSD